MDDFWKLPSLRERESDAPPIDERQRGILTKHDRKFLTDPNVREKMSENAVNQKRYQIRQRVRNGFADFSILLGLWEDDIEQIFEDYGGGLRDRTLIDTGVESTLRFLHAGLGNAQFRDAVALELTPVKYADVLASTDYEHGEIAVSINIEAEVTTVEDVNERLEQGEELTEAEQLVYDHQQMNSDSVDED